MYINHGFYTDYCYKGIVHHMWCYPNASAKPTTEDNNKYSIAFL